MERQRCAVSTPLAIAALSALLVLSGHAAARVIHVPSGEAPTIQSGIDTSADGDTVLVADGHYYERIRLRGKAILLASRLVDGGDAAHIDATVIDGDPLVLGSADTASVVCAVSGEDTTTVIQGFTITNGIGTESSVMGGRVGGGVYCEASSPIIARCVISQNAASAYGGAIACRGPAHGFAMPGIRGCTLAGNSADLAGGGIASSRNAYPKVTKTILWGNSAQDGPAIALLGSEGTTGAIVSYSDVQGGESDVSVGPDCELFWTEGNIDCNPLFCDPYGGDYWLRDESCCAGAGSSGGDIGCHAAGCTVDSCWYHDRVLERIYVLRGEPGEHSDNERTISVSDATGSQDGNMIDLMMDMRGERWLYVWPPGQWLGEIYFFGQILRYDPASGDTFCIARTPPRLPGTYSLANGQDVGPGLTWWYAVQGVDSLHHLSLTWNGHWISELIGVYPAISDSITGLAFDRENLDLWAIFRGEPDMLVEYDVSGSTPEVIQGPFPAPWPYGPDSGAAAGLDYCEEASALVAVNHNTNEAVWFTDIWPGYGGPPGDDEPGLVADTSYVLMDTESPGAAAVFSDRGVLYVAGCIDTMCVLDAYVDALTLATEDPILASTSVRLMPLSPNPFAGSASLEYELMHARHVKLEIFNLAGRRVATLVNAQRQPGRYLVRWDANGLASGVYFCRLSAGPDAAVRKAVLLR
jgi:hypothetical protein